ncbi:SRPBCC domain-containing protein [Streptomyces sp. NPDC003038]|uniref:SRPBCC domain-containing protein n=1 Tax=unclassified Streptomyces TaxID=2593676 RepID=UPI0033A50F6D
MEHQVFVPVPADDLRAVLRDPARVARCVPGLQQDADTESGPLSGRLKIRVGGHTVTYRGALALAERGPDHFTVDGEGAEVRGTGTVTLALALRLSPEEDGTRLDFTAGATADGRAAAFAPEAVATSVHRLLDRAAEQLAALAAAPEPTAGAAVAQEPVTDAVAEAEEAEEAEGDGEEDLDIDEVTASVFESEVPPSSPDPFLEGGFDDLDDLGGLPRPPAEAAHARRTMIGRSAEEVDHAPPRGRYAPVPAPTYGSAGDHLRWIAPVAALALASAVVLGRALRRRR